MSHAGGGAGGAPDPRAEHAASRSGAGESKRREPSRDQSPGRYNSPEAQLGGADAVEKTSYVVGGGAEPETRSRGDYVARRTAGGLNLGAWIVGGIAALIGLVYAIGVFR